MKIDLRASTLILALLFGPSALAQGGQTAMQLNDTVILSVSGAIVRWATIHRVPDSADGDDPYFHVEVFERKRGKPPWQYRLLALHMAVTPEALLRSRLNRKARTYSYKPVESLFAYDAWRKAPREQRDASVCRTRILDCIP
jgi:hypothetical protein